MVFIWAAGIVVTLVAIGVGIRNQQKGKRGPALSPPLETAVYAIGDLHGDAECGKYWVDKLDLIDEKGQWRNPNASLVFMGDYVDKGPYGYQTMQFVKSLMDSYPDNIEAILG